MGALCFYFASFSLSFSSTLNQSCFQPFHYCPLCYIFFSIWDPYKIFIFLEFVSKIQFFRFLVCIVPFSFVIISYYTWFSLHFIITLFHFVSPSFDPVLPNTSFSTHSFSVITYYISCALYRSFITTSIVFLHFQNLLLLLLFVTMFFTHNHKTHLHPFYAHLIDVFNLFSYFEFSHPQLHLPDETQKPIKTCFDMLHSSVISPSGDILSTSNNVFLTSQHSPRRNRAFSRPIKSVSHRRWPVN